MPVWEQSVASSKDAKLPKLEFSQLADYTTVKHVDTAIRLF